MIFPILKGILSFKKAPITWLLFLLNVNIFLFQWGYEIQNSKTINAFYYSDEVIAQQGIIFASLIQKSPEKFDELHIKLSDQVFAGNDAKKLLLGQLALRNEHFRSIALKMDPFGDRVAFNQWRNEYQNFVILLENQPNYKYGVSSRNSAWQNFISYQFSHGGFYHLIGNMVFLLILGSVLEPLLGSLFFMLFYLAGGAVAAIFYFKASGTTLVPLVGASGSISALMGIYIAMFWQQKARFFYVLLPFREYMGMLMLPVPWVFAFWFVSDFSGYLSNLKALGGVAYAAHLGGLFCGILFALVLMLSLKSFRLLKPA